MDKEFSMTEYQMPDLEELMSYDQGLEICFVKFVLSSLFCQVYKKVDEGPGWGSLVQSLTKSFVVRSVKKRNYQPLPPIPSTLCQR